MATKLLTVTQVGELMQVDKHKVYKLIDIGLLQTIQVSGKRGKRVPEFEYERFLHDALGKDIDELITEKEEKHE